MGTLKLHPYWGLFLLNCVKNVSHRKTRTAWVPFCLSISISWSKSCLGIAVLHIKPFSQRSSFFFINVTRCDAARKALEPAAHSSGLTGSRCLASEASYWPVFMFLSTFLFTSSTCLPCCGRLLAPCRYSWSPEQQWPGPVGDRN